MEPVQDNMQKYENYREQMGRLKKALSSGFYLEAVFIEYAILEDRLESILRHSGRWKEPREGVHRSIQWKKNQVAKMAEEKGSLAARYFSDDTLDRIIVWKDKRNSLIHALMNQSVHTEELKELAEQGQVLVRELSNRGRNLARALERQQNSGRKQ